jgi:hypothetical protein
MERESLFPSLCSCCRKVLENVILTVSVILHGMVGTTRLACRICDVADVLPVKLLRGPKELG